MFAINIFEETAGAEGGLAWLVWVVLAIFILMVALGWLASRNGWLNQEEEAHHHDHAGHDHDHATHENDHAHAAKSHADKLTDIEGVGPKVAKLLNGLGIHSFADLAKADVASINSALETAGYSYMDPSSWPKQAALAAKGDSAGLKKLQDSLKGGRKA